MKNKIYALLIVTFFSTTTLSVFAQNQVYWREGFEPETTDLTTINPTSMSPVPTSNVTYYFNGIGGSWYALNTYRTTGSACPSPYGANHPRFRNMGTGGTFDSGYLVTSIVNFGIKEFHFSSTRASRGFTIQMTSDTGALTTNWTTVAYLPTSTSTCTDIMVDVNNKNAKRLKIIARSGTDSDIDSIWLTSFDPIPLPVKFGSLQALQTNGAIKVSWNIVSEVNTEIYYVEKLVNGNYQTIASVKANNASSYSYVDANVSPNQNIYRIKAVDKDGKISISSSTGIQLNNSLQASLSVYPNPVVNGKVNVQINNLPKGIYRANVFEGLGKLIHSSVVQYQGGVLSQTLDIANLKAAGNYYLQLTNGQTSIQQRLLVR